MVALGKQDAVAAHDATVEVFDHHRPLAPKGAALLLFLGGHSHDAEGRGVAAHVAVKPVGQLPGVGLVGLDPFAMLIQALRGDNEVANAHG